MPLGSLYPPENVRKKKQAKNERPRRSILVFSMFPIPEVLAMFSKILTHFSPVPHFYTHENV